MDEPRRVDRVIDVPDYLGPGIDAIEPPNTYDEGGDDILIKPVELTPRQGPLRIELP